MGTVGEITVIQKSLFPAVKAIYAAYSELVSIERLMSRFSKNSDVGRVNSSIPGVATTVNPLTANVIKNAITWSEISDGRFDACIGEAVDLWDIGRRRVPPTVLSARRLAGQRFFSFIRLECNAGRYTVVRSTSDVKIDLGGIAKGFGIDRAVQALRDSGVNNALINVGGDLYALGCSSDASPWRIGVRNPQNPDRIDGYIELKNKALASSGDYYQFFEYAGNRYHHILNTCTGHPRNSLDRSVTICADNCMTADAAATTIFGASPSLTKKILSKSLFNAEIVRLI